MYTRVYSITIAYFDSRGMYRDTIPVVALFICGRLLDGKEMHDYHNRTQNMLYVQLQLIQS